MVYESKENWDWLKFFKGFFDGKNYAKAIVLGTAQAIIVSIVVCVFLTGKNIFTKNQGTIVQTDNHAKSETQNHSLFNIFKIG